jgi:2-C-methyl-D-erythritol 2,4-cyclodiphosphate synthase
LTGAGDALESTTVSKNGALRVGLGFDAHALKAGRPLRLGGVTIPGRRGLAGHSDADVLLHALMDALLGAMAQPDIGSLFPDTDASLKDADSSKLARRVIRRIDRLGGVVRNVDCILICDWPKLSPHHAAIRDNIAQLLGLPPGSVGLKAKTTEGTRVAVRNGSIAAMVVVLLEVAGS